MIQCKAVRNSGERQRVVHPQARGDFAQVHLLDDVAQRRVVRDELQRVRFELFAIQVQCGEFLPNLGESTEIEYT